MDQTKPLKDLFHFLELKKLKGYTTIMETHSKTHLKVPALTRKHYWDMQKIYYPRKLVATKAIIRINIES